MVSQYIECLEFALNALRSLESKVTEAVEYASYRFIPGNIDGIEVIHIFEIYGVKEVFIATVPAELI